MFRASLKLFSRQLSTLAFITAALTLMLLTPAASRAQRSKGTGDGDDLHPAFSDFKGVRIGTMAEEARKKLGNPRDKSADQDFYMINDNEAVQIYYDKSGAVSAISIDYLGGANGIPTCKEVLGAEAEPKADGSIYKMIRYPKAGYWVSYSRTAGNDSTVTVTMQKIQ
jgi:hypothetical protein